MRKIEVYCRSRYDGETEFSDWEREFAVDIEFPDEIDLKRYGSLVNAVVQKTVDVLMLSKDLPVEPEPDSKMLRYMTESTRDPRGCDFQYRFCLLNFMTHELKYIHERITKS